MAITTISSSSVKPFRFRSVTNAIQSRRSRVVTGHLSPVFHLFRKRALRAIRIVLQTKILVNLQERLLIGDRPGEIAPPRIVAEQTSGRGFDSAVRQRRAEL